MKPCWLFIWGWGVLLAAGAGPASAQPGDIRWLALTVADGLSDDNVYAIIQDRQGFLWVGTAHGLNRYDGYGFTPFFSVPGDSTTLSDNRIHALFEDSRGLIWVGTRGEGLNRYDPATETFRRLRPGPGPPDTVRDLAEHPAGSGVIWAATEAGLLRYDPAAAAFRSYRHDAADATSLSDDFTFALHSDRAGRLWVLAPDGLNRYDPATDAFVRYPIDVGQEELYWYVPDILEQDDGTFWLSLGYYLLQFDPETGRASKVDYPWAYDGTSNGMGVYSLLEDAYGARWLTNYFQLFYHDPTSGVWRRYAVGGERLGVRARAQLVDRSGMMWFGTQRGIRVFNLWQFHRTWYVKNKRRDELNEASQGFTRDAPGFPMPDNSTINDFLEDRTGRIWIGSSAGLFRYHPATDTFDFFTASPPGSNTRAVLGLHEDPMGHLWVATSSGLFRFDTNTNTSDWRDLFQVGEQVSGYAFHQDPQGDLWVGTIRHGLYRRSPDGRVTWYRPDPDRPDGLASSRISALLGVANDPGALWVGTSDAGLNRFDPATGTAVHYPPDLDRTGSLVGSRVTDLHYGRDGTLWVGTDGALNRFDPADESFTAYGQAHGLPGASVLCMLEDDHGRLWLRTNQGLARFDPATETAVALEVTDGLRSLQPSDQACLRLRDGRFLFGGQQGLTKLHPDSLGLHPVGPQVALTALRVGGRMVRPGEAHGNRVLLPRALALSDRLTLGPDDHSFGFDFAALHFVDPARNRYAYRLGGVDEDWVDLGERRSVSFSGLPPGDYTFHVRAANRDGVWGEAAALGLTLLPPWWRTGWAYGLYLALALGLVFGYVQWRSHTLRRHNRELAEEVARQTAEMAAQNTRLADQAEQLHELDRVKSRFFANLSHEFRTPLTLIQGPVQGALSGTYGPLDPLLRDHLEITARHTGRLRRLIDQLLDLTRLDAGAMQLQAAPGDLIAFIRRVMGYFASLSQRTLIGFALETEAEAIPLYFDDEKLEHVVVNLLANAFKFTPAGGQIAVRVTEGPGGVRVAVADTGPGIPAEAVPHLFDRFYQVTGGPAQPYEGTGIGLALVKELVERHGGAVGVESTPGQGSTFFFTLPKGHAHFAPEEIVAANGRAEDAPTDQPPEAVARLLAENGTAALPEDAVEAAPLILLVEDNDDLRTFMRDQLGATYRIVEAADGAEGFRRACEQRPDLILSDVMMPGMSGLELLARLKAHDELQTVPVILLTARTEAEDRRAGFEAEADAYLAKPFALPELQTRIASLLESRSRLQRVFGQSVVHLASDDPDLDGEDRRFLIAVEAAVGARMGESGFGVEELADAVHVSRSQLYRRLEALTGESPAALIRRLRLERARQLLTGGGATSIGEAAATVGFGNASYFARLYEKHFGERPTTP